MAASISRLYADSEKMQDLLGQAHREATDKAQREALANAGSHYRAMRDEIVKAMGVDYGLRRAA